MGLNINVVTDCDQLAWAVDRLLNSENHTSRFLGLDCEWDAVRGRKVPQIPELLQIARADGFCILVRLNVLRCVPHPLKDLLENRHYWKLGVGVVDDALKLKQGYRVDTRGVLDVRHLARALKIKPKGMQFLSEIILGAKKTRYNRRYCWTTPFLSEEVKKYAAGDAVNAARIFEKLNNKRLEQKWGDAWKRWGQERYVKETFDLWKEFVGRKFHYCDAFNDPIEYSWQDSLS